jgi:hypothetical protein
MDALTALAAKLSTLASFEGGLRGLLLLNLFDGLSTVGWVEGGQATEANPIMAAAMNGGPGVFLLSKIALVSLAVALLWRVRHHRAARIAVVPACLLYAFVGGGHVGWAVGNLFGLLGPLV